MNTNNVFSGPNSLLDYYDPDKNPPTPLVEIPGHPFVADGVRIYAKLMSFLPATNIKSLPALSMLQDAKEKGLIDPNTQEIIEYSSGSTAISLAILSRIMGIPNVRALISNKTSAEKINLLRFFGLDLTLYAGASQPQPFDPLGGIMDAVKLGEQPNVFTPNQYSNDMNYKAHMKWTGPQIIRQLPNIAIFCSGIGTSGMLLANYNMTYFFNSQSSSGTMTGTGLYLKKAKPGTVTVGVCTAQGDRVPGPRTLELLQPVEFPWREAADHIEEMASPESFETAMELCRMGILCGPSSGLALCGLYSFLKKMKDSNSLDLLRNSDGEIPAVFLCMDAPQQYMSEFFEKIPERALKPVRNAELLTVDTYPYLPNWEISPSEALSIMRRHRQSRPALLVDIRQYSDFMASPMTIPRLGKDSLQVVNLDIQIKPDDPHPYRHASTMVSQWKALDKRLHNPQDSMFNDSFLSSRVVFFSCYSGGTARAAAPILRHRGIEAYNIIGGISEWEQEIRRSRDRVSPIARL